MPFKSQAQMKWMYANKPKMAKEWAKETGKIKGMNNKQKKIDKAARKIGF